MCNRTHIKKKNKRRARNTKLSVTFRCPEISENIADLPQVLPTAFERPSRYIRLSNLIFSFPGNVSSKKHDHVTLSMPIPPEYLLTFHVASTGQSYRHSYLIPTIVLTSVLRLPVAFLSISVRCRKETLNSLMLRPGNIDKV